MLNAMHHSRSKRALVGIAHDDGCLFVQVQDWGMRFIASSSVPMEANWRRRITRAAC
jgi:hypothetical protein